MQNEEDKVNDTRIEGSDVQSDSESSMGFNGTNIIQAVPSESLGLNFGDAFSDMLANGTRLSRESWGNSNKFIYLDNEVTPKGIFLNEGEVCHEWVARHVDLLAKDWFVVK